MGSSDLYDPEHRGRNASVNFLTCHDGFTLNDLYSYNWKHNEANGWGNTDGSDDNRSWNCGVEGDTDDENVLFLRHKLAKNAFAVLMCSRGTPMFFAGDEFLNTQFGNNNAYCQDNQLTWLDWSQASSGLTAFTAALIHLRKRIPALVENRWWEEGDGNVRWLNRYAQPLSTDEWQNGPKQLQILLSDRFLIAINATLEVTEIVLPAGEWHAIPPFAGEDNPVITAVWQGPAHGLCVFQR